MSNAMRDRLSAAKSGAGQAVKEKSAKAPLVESSADLRVVSDTEATVTALGVTAVAEATGVMAGEGIDAPIVLPKIVRDEPVSPIGAQPITAVEPATLGRVRLPKGNELVDKLTAPPAPMGSAAESRSITIPMSEDAYALLQKLDRGLALAHGRAINRQQLVAAAIELALANPEKYAKRYVNEHAAGATWKRRLQSRIPVETHRQLPMLRYTGHARQSAGMLTSLAVADVLGKLAEAAVQQQPAS